MHRRVLMNYPFLAPEWQEQRDRIEDRMMERVEGAWMSEVGDVPEDLLAETVNELIEENLSGASRISGDYIRAGMAHNAPWWFRKQWKHYCRKAGMDIDGK